MMYRVRRVQIGNSGEIAWESKRAEIIPWPVELTVGGLYALRSGRLYRVEGREDRGAEEGVREIPDETQCHQSGGINIRRKRTWKLHT